MLSTTLFFIINVAINFILLHRNFHLLGVVIVHNAKEVLRHQGQKECDPKINALVSAGFSRHQAYLSVGIHTLYYRCWVKVLKKVDDMNAGDEYMSNKTN